jgi:hypothetical protein
MDCKKLKYVMKELSLIRHSIQIPSKMHPLLLYLYVGWKTKYSLLLLYVVVIKDFKYSTENI